MKLREYSTAELFEFAQKYLTRNYAPNPDFILAKGRGCWMYDTEGKRYLDMLSCYSALNVGHRHSKIMAQLHAQLDTLTTNANCFYEEQNIAFRKELVEFCARTGIMPPDAMAIIMNSGAEAVDTAMKIARKWGYVQKGIPPGRAELISFENNFHGRTLGAISLSTTPEYREPFEPLLLGIITVPFGDTKALMRSITKNTAAIFIEPIQGEGGIIVPPPGYLSDVKSIAHEAGILLVADEIQTGFGRTGKMFACMHERVRPDLLILGKALGGGIAVSAVVGPKEIMGVFSPGDHGSTFGGNPMACRAGRAALAVIEQEKLDAQAETLGAYFQKKLVQIAHASNSIKEVRGRGLLIGVEVKKNAPNADEFCRRLAREGVLCKGTRERVIRFAPPLIITKEEIDWGIRRIQKVFST